ncbi:MAG: ROK family protein [Proteobacteria bacterium]|nr:ROK family protein [Pseudomonadota bacterium]
MSGNKDYVIGVDIGGSHIACCAVDPAAGEIVENTVVDEPVDSKAGKTEILDTWSKAVRTVVAGRGNTAPDGIGFAMPGPFDYRTGVAGFSGNDKYDSLYGVNVAEELAASLGLASPLRFINDATAFAVGSAWRGAGRRYRRIVAATLGTGFGSAFVADGVPVVSGDAVPEHGCVWHLPFEDGIADDYISTRWVVERFADLKGYRIEGVKGAAERAAHDAGVRAVFERYGRNLGEILGPWIGRFDAQALIFGGNVAGAIDLFGPALLQALAEHGADVAVEVCPLRDKAALLGAARLFESGFWRRIEDDLPRA